MNIEEVNKNSREIEKHMTETERRGLEGISLYFNRIHDRLFTLNNMCVVGYLAIIILPECNMKFINILLPIVNMFFLITIEYFMMEKSRDEANIKNKNMDEIQKVGDNVQKVTLYSLSEIIFTLIVIINFLMHLYWCLKL